VRNNANGIKRWSVKSDYGIWGAKKDTPAPYNAIFNIASYTSWSIHNCSGRSPNT